MTNKMTLTFSAISSNESFARVTVASFVAQLDPTLEELTEIKTVVSEAVTNCIIHGYGNTGKGIVRVCAELDHGALSLSIHDDGAGIQDIEQARQPLFTTKPELERSGMGFTIMENFMDHVTIESVQGKGTTIFMTKAITHNKAVCK
ncbi:anti-sigma F factor [Sporolactobacillus sp. Y61]|jgi:stage II sporulation protein AB (anti-sigma F factor)|uniref:Anti-sigma F factor n=1 Tax=Sporolactobacillus sp. Y61 TaxID=3160863 RepID=A0AAU8IDR9_9BACL|nr:anti-sigma F factor [Sporolactobacillus sp. THM19-2]RYL93186.1 anti-sigma F factor [Sporolactobacillus sp. THM19-2]